MQFSSVLLLASAALASSAYSNGTDSTITYETTIEQVVTAYTTYCPAATEITTNGKTITVTGATTLTITDCPCTIKSTFLTSGVPSSAPATSPSSAAVTKATKAVPSKAVGVSSSGVPKSAQSLSTAEGGAAKVGVAGLAALAGVAAYLL
ncbi:unnamed protein product [Ambrosiozyma monospora]|uniref:Unnamed protein product n=1 Tax=Ambrosiozyma monospora TaxID=43982 RepID=A0ACB5THU1_AMBMO|nr:unnamed protein product [Ambrosiozyma monospora]